MATSPERQAWEQIRKGLEALEALGVEVTTGIEKHGFATYITSEKYTISRAAVPGKWNIIRGA